MDESNIITLCAWWQKADSRQPAAYNFRFIVFTCEHIFLFTHFFFFVCAFLGDANSVNRWFRLFEPSKDSKFTRRYGHQRQKPGPITLNKM
jgi:hypothetical protein